MYEDTARNLQTLREEVHRCFTSSDSSELYHAMMIVRGRSSSTKELEETWERFTKSNFLPPPLTRGSFRRTLKSNAVGFDLRLMSSVKDVSAVPTQGKDLIIVATVNDVLHFRIFDGNGKVVVDTDEQRLPEQARQIEDLRKQLASLWPPHELTRSDKDRVTTAVTSIVGHAHVVETCIFGVAGKTELNRFTSQARSIRSVAVSHLDSQGIDFGPIPRDLHGLSYLLCCLAWDYPSRVTYAIETYNRLDRLSDPDRSPFASRETFEAWELGKLNLSPGFYFAKLSMDVRSCTVSAIDAILGLSALKSAERKKAAPRRDPLTEERDKWIYDMACNLTPYKTILRKLEEHKGWELIESIQGIRHLAKAYAKRHGLPDPPPRRS